MSNNKGDLNITRTLTADNIATTDIIISGSVVLQPTVSSSAGADNVADWILNRFDLANGFNRIGYSTGGTPQWGVGSRSGSENLLIYDEANGVAQVTFTQGAGTTGKTTFAAQVNIDVLTASSLVATDASKNLTSNTNNINANLNRLRLQGANIDTTTSLVFDDTESRKIKLYDDANTDDNQYHGLGIGTNTVLYQVPTTGHDHVFRAGTSSSTSDTLMTIKGTGIINIPNLTASNVVTTDGSKNLTSTPFTSTNTASAIVVRDGSGNFAAGTITAALSGNATSASTVSTSNEASDTTCFPLFVTASGTQTLEPKNNINLRYNASSNLLSVNLAVIDNGGAAFPTISAISALKFGDALGAGSYIGYGGPQFPRSTGVSSTGSLYHARNTFYNPVISDFSYGVSGSGVTLLELADTAINLKYAASGTVGNPVTFTTGFSMSQSTGISTIRGVNIDNGGAALTGTNTPLTFAGSLARGNYINLGTSGRNIGVVSGGNAFLSANLDYNSTTPGYVYNSSNAATAIELGQAGISFKYAVAGTAGNAVTPTTAMFLDSANGRIGINKSNPTYVLEVGGGADNTTQVAFSGGSTTCHFTPTSTSFRLGSLTSGKSLSLEYSNAQAGIVIDGSSGDVTISAGNLIVNTAGKTLKVKEGSNACKGTGATMVGGTVTVNTTAVATGDQILLTKTAAGGTSTTGMPVITIVNGTSFTITGGALDTSTWSWLIVKAA